MLSPTQLSAREGCVTASFLPKLMAGNESEILREWQRLVGDPAWVEDDLSDSWPVQFGSFVEPFALDWHEKKTGRALSRRGDVVRHPTRDYFAATLDAFRNDDATVIDCKAPGPWRKIDDVIACYTPQLIGQRACIEAQRASLLIVHGGQEPAEYAVEWESDYEKTVWERVDQFWHCVEMLIEPTAQAPIAPPVKPEKTYNMTGDNLWASEAAMWLDNHHAARLAQAAEKELKGLVPLDAARAYGHGIEIRRDRAGRLSLRERLK
jgi:predicted phage-related endonuclease